MTQPAKKCRVVCPGPDAELKRAKKVAEALKKFIEMKPKANDSKYPRVEDWIFVGNCYGHDARVVATQEIKRVVPIHRDGQPQPEVPWEYVAEAELVNRKAAWSVMRSLPAPAMKRSGTRIPPSNSDRWRRPAPKPKHFR
jgi:hypothetical protein